MTQLKPLPLTVSCFSKIQIGFSLLVPAHLGSPGKRAIKRVCVCVFLLDAELYTAAVCRARSPDCAVHSNASVNQQRAAETRALNVIHRCDVIDGYLSVQSHQ